MAARTKTVVRARTLIDLGADNVPAGPVVEVVTSAHRILVGGIVESIRLELADVYDSCARYTGIDGVEAQTCGVTGSFKGVSIRRTQGPLTNELRGAREHAVARTLIERLFGRGDLTA